MRSRILSVVFLLIIINASSQDGKMTLKQCIETALVNNIDVKQAGLQADAAEVNMKQAKS